MAEDRSVQEIYCLPNERPMKEFERQAIAVRDAIKAKYGEPKFEKYRATVDPLLDKIREKASQEWPLTELAAPLDQLLADQINEGDAAEALLREFWTQLNWPRQKDLRSLSVTPANTATHSTLRSGLEADALLR